MRMPSRPHMLATARHSRGSPTCTRTHQQENTEHAAEGITLVPVPWHSTMAVFARSAMPAIAYARRMSLSWLAGSGTVMPFVLPSLLVAVARMTPRMGSPSRSASASLLMCTAVTPSPLPYPSALASKDLHDPEGESTPCSAMLAVIRGERMMFTPPTTAEAQLPLWTSWQAV